MTVMAPWTVFLLVILCIALLRVSRRLYRMGPQANRGTLGIEATPGNRSKRIVAPRRSGFKRRRSPYDSQDTRKYAEIVAPESAHIVVGLLHSLIRLTLMSAGWGTLWHQAPNMG
jgi:hypothetical protein